MIKDHFTDQLKMVGRGLPVWAQFFARIPFLFLFAYELCLAWIDRRTAAKPTSCRTVSVIIPTLNEEKSILDCIYSAYGNRSVCEIIVVDAGSSDQTVIHARQAGARVIIHDKPLENGGGRGGQIKAGIRAATGDVAMIVHADVIIEKDTCDCILTMLNQNPKVVGGSVGCRFDSPKCRFRLIEYANDFRAAFFKISFGDQIQFFRRQPVVDHDLFPDMPLMEDIEFSLRLRRLGRQIHLFGNALVSPRRWDRVGFKNAAWVFVRVFGYLLMRLWTTPDTAQLYKKYYGLK